MKIDKQEAEGSIYNIAGNFINNSTLRADNIYLSVDDGTFREFTKPDQDTLKLQFGIDYLAALSSDLSNKKLITRRSIALFFDQLKKTKEIAIVGNPGVGKTCMLYNLTANLEDVIFLNLKNRSLQTVLLHLINRIYLKKGKQLIDQIDVEFGLELLQGLLFSTEFTFMIDECEDSDGILERILPLMKWGNIFIYASQAQSVFDANQIEVFPLNNFDREDATLFLVENDIELDVFSFNDLYEASKGHALYLYYFSQFSISPLPKGIGSYHNAIWQKLDSYQKECMIFASITQYPITISDLAELVFENKMQFAVERVNGLRLLNKIGGGALEVFHSTFKLFILDELIINGNGDFYRIRLGDYFHSKNNLLQSAYLLVDSAPQKVKEFGFEVLPIVSNRGDINFANKLIRLLLQDEYNEQTEGYLKLNLYQNLRLLSKDENREEIRDEALDLLKKSGSKRLYNSALMNKAMDLIEDGEVIQGQELVDKIITEDDESDPDFTGQLLVSLSKVYIDLSQYKKAADACKKSFDIFANERNLYGMLSSLANLASCLNHVDGYRDLSEQYALKLLEVPTDEIYFGLKLIATNVLTSVYRQKREFEKAKKYGSQAVSLCQKYKVFRKALLNLINYGNIFRDTGDISEALKIFEEALSYAAELDIKREQSRVYWIMSSIHVELGDTKKGLELIDRATACAEAVNYNYGIGHCLQERGEVLELQNEFSEAAKSFEKSYHVFASMGNMNKQASRSLSNAILMYMKSEDKASLDDLIRQSVSTFNTDKFIDLGGIAGYSENTIDIHGYYLSLTQQYISSSAAPTQISVYLDYLKYCKGDLKLSRKPFKELIFALADGRGNEIPRLTTLGVLIEQSADLFDCSDLTDLIGCIRKVVPKLLFRETFRDKVFLLSHPLGFNIEMNVHREDLLGAKLCLEFLLFIIAMPDVFTISGVDKKESFCKILCHEAETLNEVIKSRGGKEIRFQDDQQIRFISEEGDYKNPIIFVVGKDYEPVSDLIKNSGTKSNIFFLRALMAEISAHFYHLSGDEVYHATQGLTGKIAAMFDYTNVDSEFEHDCDYKVDLSKIDELIS